MTGLVSSFTAIVCKDWLEDVHRYEPKEPSHKIKLSKEYNIHSWHDLDCLMLQQRVASGLTLERNIQNISTDNEFLTVSLDTGIRIQIPIRRSIA